MTTETIVASDAATEIPASEVAETTGLAAPEPTEGGGEAQPAEAEKSPSELRIEQLERDLASERRRVVKRDRTQGKLYQELAQAREVLQRGAAPAEQEQGREIDPVALATHIADVREITAKSNKVVSEGEKRFSDFKQAVVQLAEEVGPLFDQHGRPTSVAEAVLDSDDPAGLLHYLGTHPDTAAELADLKPTQLGRRIERIETLMKAKPRISNAPAPLTPVKGTSANSNDLNDEISADEYLRRYRAKQTQRR